MEDDVDNLSNNLLKNRPNKLDFILNEIYIMLNYDLNIFFNYNSNPGALYIEFLGIEISILNDSLIFLNNNNYILPNE